MQIINLYPKKEKPLSTRVCLEANKNVLRG